MTYISKTIHFSLEEFSNRGVTKEESKDVIQKVFGEKILNIEDSSFNRSSNWNASLRSNMSDEDIEFYVGMVEFHLDQIAREKEGRPTVKSASKAAADVIVYALRGLLGLDEKGKNNE